MMKKVFAGSRLLSAYQIKSGDVKGRVGRPVELLHHLPHEGRDCQGSGTKSHLQLWNHQGLKRRNSMELQIPMPIWK